MERFLEFTFLGSFRVKKAKLVTETVHFCKISVFAVQGAFPDESSRFLVCELLVGWGRGR